ncbi:Signal transduction histidine kinase [Lachnospiraceae bacterium]|nr:Signal transduction histidine kinase [Lachnospiraceae bacterium]
MVQVTFTLSRESDVANALSKWHQITKGKSVRRMFLLIYSVGISVEKLKDKQEEILREFPGLAFTGLCKKHSVNGERFIRLSFILFDKTIVSMFSRSFADTSETEAIEELGALVEDSKDSAAVLLLAAGGSAKLSNPLSEFEAKYNIPVFGSWTADFVANDPECHFIWHNGELSRGMVALVFSGKTLSLHMELLSGWKPLGKSFSIETRKRMTRGSLGETVLKFIDGRPASDIYRRYLHVEPNEAFIENIRQFPFAVKRKNLYFSRLPYYCDAAGELYFIGDIQDDDQLSFSSADPDTMFEESVEASRRLADFGPEAIFFFGSGMRKSFIGDEERELLCFQNILPNTQYLRARGQILYNDGAGGIHNTCAVAIGLREGTDVAAEGTRAYNVRTFMRKNLIHPLADRNTSFLLAITDDLNEALEKAEHASKAKSDFLSNMSHEIRTPINAILGMDEMILRESINDDVLGYAQDIRNAGVELLGLINDILDFSKIESGRLTIIPVDYKPAEMIRDLYQMIKKRADDKGLKLVIDADPDIPEVLFGDEVRVKQAITNILTNAVKYSEKGTVTFKISVLELHATEVILEFSIKDEGIGIKKEDIKKLFDSFQRLDEKRNRNIEGTGLGMGITRQLLKLMDTDIMVESEYGKGSTFSFVLRQQIRSGAPMGKPSFDHQKGSSMKKAAQFTAPDVRVLVVDDTPMNITVIKALLKQNKIEVDSAESGAEAIEKVKENHYDIVFLDFRMPNMTGIETLHAIRKLEQNMCKDSPFICLTANAVTGAMEEYRKAGFDDVITKPVDPALLQDKLLFYIPQDMIKINMDAALGIESNDDEPEVEIPEGLKNIPFMSIEDGIENCGSAEAFLDTVNVFYSGFKKQVGAIQGFLDAGDIENYTIKVHALKSSARIIGIGKLSTLAAALEKAGDDKRVDIIKKDTPELMQLANVVYKELDYCLGEKNGPDDDRPEIDPDEWIEALMALQGFTEDFDHENLGMILDMLKKYKIPKENRELYENIKEAAVGPDWQKLSDLLKDIEA